MAQSQPFVGIQIGAISFVDEGVEPVLDLLQERAGVNALLISALSWSRGNAGRAAYGFPDHGVQEPDNLQGGAFFKPNPIYYGATHHTHFEAPDPLTKGFDTFADVIPAAKKRGMKVYPYYCETSASGIKHLWQPGFIHFLDRDHWGKVATRPSLLNPNYKIWWHSVIEDWFQTHDLSGMLWGIERQSPLMDILRADSSTGFDDYFKAEARARGIDVERAIKGYQEIDHFLQGVRKGDRPRDGVFVTFMRHVLHHPEVLMWEKMWLDAHQQFYHEIGGLIKYFNPKNEVGLGIWQIINTYNPYLKAQYDPADYADHADWLKPVLYHTPAGARFANFSDSWQKGILADASVDGAYAALTNILELEPYVATHDQAPMAGFKPEYVKQWTADLIAATGGKCKVYSGIGVGVGDGGPTKKITPEEVRDAVHASFDGGASGVLISRNYSEADLAGIDAVGAALKERGAAMTIRAAIFGAGFAKAAYLPALAQIPDVEVVAIASAHLENAQAVAKQFNIPAAYSDWRELLDKHAVDLVGVATPTVYHAPMTLAALDARAHVICEKPMAMNADEAKQMLDKAESLHRVHMMGHELRFNPNRRKIKELLMSGALGKIYHVNIVNITAGWGNPASRAAGEWLADAAMGGGRLGANGSHQFDLLRWWFGDVGAVSGQVATHVPNRVDKTTGAPYSATSDDQTSFLAELTNGLLASVFMSGVAAHGVGNSTQIFGSEGTIRLADNDEKLWFGRKGEELQDITEIDPNAELPGVGKGIWNVSFVSLVKEATDAIREGRPVMDGATFADGYQTQRAMDAIRQSWVERRWITL